MRSNPGHARVGIVLGLCLGGWMQGAGLELTGVGERSRLSVAGSGGATEILVTATGGGVVGDVEWTLEWQGAVVQTKSGSAGTPTGFNGLLPGKYFLSARRVGGVETGDVSFDVVPEVVRPVNDDWADALPVIRGESVTGMNGLATLEPGEPKLAWNQGGRTIWWRWQAPDTGVATVTTRGSDFDTVLGIYTGTGLAGLKSLGSNDDIGSGPFSQVTFPHVAGTTYHIAVDGVWGDGTGPAIGTAQVRLENGAAPVIGLTSPLDGSTHLLGGGQGMTSVVMTVGGAGTVGGLKSMLVGAPGFLRMATVEGDAPWTESGIPEGEYTWMVSGEDARGLVGTARLGFSVEEKVGAVEFAETDPDDPELIPLLVRATPGRKVRLESSEDLKRWTEQATWPVFDGWVRIPDLLFPMPDLRFYRAIVE